MYQILLQFFAFMLLLSGSALGQVAGNQVYNKHHNVPPKRIVPSVVSTDSTLIVHATVLLNKKADYYLISVGVSAEKPTVIECNEDINNRIELFMKDAKTIGIKADDVYVDFISETRVYDHKIEGNVISEFFVGFEMKKNLIIKTGNLAVIDKVVDFCSERAIYDIIKVDYVNADIEDINDYLFDEALAVANKKKDKFKKASSSKLSGKHQLVAEKFNAYYPKDLYKEYKAAFESSLVETYYSSSYIKKEVRKDRTFYYDNPVLTFVPDKVIDPIAPVVGIQYSLEITMVYELER